MFSLTNVYTIGYNERRKQHESIDFKFRTRKTYGQSDFGTPEMYVRNIFQGDNYQPSVETDCECGHRRGGHNDRECKIKCVS